MDRRVCVFTVVVAVWVGSSVFAQEGDPNQYDYTLPARERLFTGTLSGLADAYQILNNGMNDESMTGDKRELILLHVIARTGMLVFDRNNVAVNTSLLEVVQPLGISVTGDKLFPEDPCDPDRVDVHWPIDPNDPNCLQIPPGANVDAAAGAINTAILPELDSILAELAQVTDNPAFSLTLTPAEVGLPSSVEVDYGDVLVLKAALLGVKAGLHALANGAYDVNVDLSNPLFNGWECGVLPESTTINAVLNAYPSLFEIQSGGAARLTQAKQNLTTALNAVDAALDYIEAETDVQEDDLLGLEGEESDPEYLAFRSSLGKLRTSLQSGAAQTYTLGSKQTFTLSQGGQVIGEVRLRYSGPLGTEEDNGWVKLPEAEGSPTWWDIDWFEVNGTLIEGGAEAWEGGQNWWGWFHGTISTDGSQITNLTFEYWNWWSYDTTTGLSAQRTTNEPITGQFNPNPLFAGAVSPRDMLPQFDSNGDAVPGTMGHGLGDDATLGGVFPGVTQQDWMPHGFEVWGGNTDYRYEPGHWYIFSNIDEFGYTKLGESEGETLTVSGNYQYYAIVARSEFLLDSIQGSNGTFYNGSLVTDDTENSANITGATDNQYATVGYTDFFDFGGTDSFTGYVVIANPGGWTGLTVVTAAEPTRLLHDWNRDGIVSIIGDVPPFVNCVYFQNCPGGVDPVTVGDCNGDGFISIVGDVPCFVDCVYFENCPE